MDRIEPTPAASRYWLGVKFFDFSEEASEALRSQLNLDKDRGLVLSDVVAESPAAKAGLKKYDVIVTGGEQPVGKASELVTAVEAAMRGAPDAAKVELKLGILRAGKSATIVVTPKMREVGSVVVDEQVFDVRRLRPGMVLPKDGKFNFNIRFDPFHADLPADMTVTISKQGKETAKIAVEQGDKAWETTADKLGDLPEEVRKQITPMIMASPVPRTDRDVITFVPNLNTTLVPNVNLDEQTFAPSRTGEALEKARRALMEDTKTIREALEKQRLATTEEVMKMREAFEKERRTATEGIEKARQYLEKSQREAVEKGKRMGAEQIVERLDDLSRQVDALRKSVEQLKPESKKE